MLVQLIRDEIARLAAIRTQTRTWIEFDKDGDKVRKLFNSRVTNLFEVSGLGSTIGEMFAHMLTQIQNPTQDRCGLIINRVIHMDVEISWHHFPRVRPGGSHRRMQKSQKQR